MEERFERFSAGMSEISRYWHKLTGDEMEKYGLKGTHSVYLLTMYRFPEGLTAPRLCELCVRDKADVSRMMSLMEKKGLVRKECVGKTLYGGIFRLTEEGMEAAEHVSERARIAVELAGKDLTEENRLIFYETLEKIVENLRKLVKEGIPENNGHEAE